MLALNIKLSFTKKILNLNKFLPDKNGVCNTFGRAAKKLHREKKVGKAFIYAGYVIWFEWVMVTVELNNQHLCFWTYVWIEISAICLIKITILPNGLHVSSCVGYRVENLTLFTYAWFIE